MRRTTVARIPVVMVAVLIAGWCSLFGTRALAQRYQLEMDRTSDFGTIEGVAFIRVEGRLVGTSAGETVVAPFEIVAPADSDQGNGRVLVEPMHYVEGAGARDWLLGHHLLFGQGFSYAGICWRSPSPRVAAEHPCRPFQSGPERDVAVVAAFAQALVAGGAGGVLGRIDHLYSFSVSDSAGVAHRLLLDPLGQDLFDLSFLVTTGWPVPIPIGFAPPPSDPEPHVPPEGAGRIVYFQTEADIILWGTTLREGLTPLQRAYEVAGGAHIPAPRAGTTGVDWIPILRALFVAGDRWIVEGIEPPPTTLLDGAPAGEIDPVYGRATGIARDADLNAAGGIRLPDVALGRGQYIAVDVDRLVLLGTYVDLSCQPRADGSTRFADQQSYGRQFAQLAQALVEDGFLLQDTADLLIEEAAASDVGAEVTCTT